MSDQLQPVEVPEEPVKLSWGYRNARGDEVRVLRCPACRRWTVDWPQVVRGRSCFDGHVSADFEVVKVLHGPAATAVWALFQTAQLATDGEWQGDIKALGVSPLDAIDQRVNAALEDVTDSRDKRIEELEGELATSQKLVVALEERWGIRREEADDLRGRLEGARSEREDWRGKAEHRLNEWRLRDADVHEAATTADEAEAAKEMWRRRAESAEQRLEEATKALIELIGLRRWLEGQAGRMPDERADAYRIAKGSSHWRRAERFLAALETPDQERDTEIRAKEDVEPDPAPEGVSGDGLVTVTAARDKVEMTLRWVVKLLDGMSGGEAEVYGPALVTFKNQLRDALAATDTQDGTEGGGGGAGGPSGSGGRRNPDPAPASPGAASTSPVVVTLGSGESVEVDGEETAKAVRERDAFAALAGWDYEGDGEHRIPWDFDRVKAQVLERLREDAPRPVVTARLLDDDGPVLLAIREAVGEEIHGDEDWRYGDENPHPNDPCVEALGDAVASAAKKALEAALSSEHPTEGER